MGVCLLSKFSFIKD
jgi:hypothetical protein